MNTKLITIVGATGSGKTDLSVKLAQHFNAPIISADSRQIFRNMAIGTAYPTQEQLNIVKHYFIARYDPTHSYTCGDYESEAIALLEQLFSKHHTVIAVGGSGLYIDALCNGMDSLPSRDEALRSELNSRLENYGLQNLLDQLCELDPEYYQKVDRNNPKRVIRALEVCLQTGMPYSTLRSGSRVERSFDIIKIGTLVPREVLYDRINNRVDQMIEDGLEAEARALYPLRDLNALQTVGYREMFEYFDGTISREQAIDLIKQNTRRYAKRQMTWFGRDKQISWFTPTDIQAITGYLQSAFCK